MADRYIPEHRRTTFKAKSAFKPDELRRRREEQQVEIRRAKREENLAKLNSFTTMEVVARPPHQPRVLPPRYAYGHDAALALFGKIHG